MREKESFMRSNRFTSIVGGLAVAVSIVMLPTSAQAVASDTVVRPGELNTSETRASGEVTFLPDTLRVRTTDAASPGSSLNKAAGYFEPISTAFPRSGSLVWLDYEGGGTARPGQQLVFDYDNVDGNGNDYNVLVGEVVYGDVWWLTGGSSADAKAADPSGAENGGSGSEWFGTLSQWADAMPNARFLAGGFSLGSGVLGDGRIESITYGADRYTFTNQAEPPATTEADVTGGYTATTKNRYLKVTMYSDTQPANTTVGDRLAWKITVKKQGQSDRYATTAFQTSQSFSDSDTWARTFAYKSGTYVVQLYKNGVRVKSWTVGTTRR
ncbi:MAG TPA: hypothetical protein VF597_00175 [Candidatus Saccharimonadales bacterium]|jgi:hypothetical protein